MYEIAKMFILNVPAVNVIIHLFSDNIHLQYNKPICSSQNTSLLNFLWLSLGSCRTYGLVEVNVVVSV